MSTPSARALALFLFTTHSRPWRPILAPSAFDRWLTWGRTDALSRPTHIDRSIAGRKVRRLLFSAGRARRAVRDLNNFQQSSAPGSD
uniref:Putative secreted protein n=1 Tax=Anopheles darlingi TaxID=43151 RepID=A0A2M4D2G4_ANODA